MKYLLLTSLLISLLSCNKDDVKDTQPVELPTVTNVSTSSEVINGKARPKFTITLNVPDPSQVNQLEVFQNSNFPNSRAGVVLKPTTTQYIVIDSTATYPPVSPVKYFAFFTMKGYSYAGYYAFDLK